MQRELTAPRTGERNQMKLKTTKRDENGKPIYVVLKWVDHHHSCRFCMNVETAKTATWINACALGSALLAEQAIEMQRPAQKEKEQKVFEWAKAAGVFKIGKNGA